MDREEALINLVSDLGKIVDQLETRISILEGMFGRTNHSEKAGESK